MSSNIISPSDDGNVEQNRSAQRLREIVSRAIALPKDQRDAYIAHASESDAALAAEARALVAAHDAAGSFMGSPTNKQASPPAASPSDPTLVAPLREGPGTRVGPYKLLELIGEGGFGSVFLADQAAPVRRRVALKIIKLGMDTRGVVARFEQERQALAMMDHPHIARVLDAGSTESGRPFFVMEYVKGDPITTFADAHKLTLRERLELLTQVCLAVQHAHHKGIIHRDIKPSNVLVSMVDGKPMAKVIDFGIAKATGAAGGTLTEKTLFTEHRALIGTPEYMSPEQAEGSPDIDTRADVYGLGVLMYELLTGTTPFDAKRLRSAAYAEIQRIIREEEPPSPSLRMSRDIQRDVKQLADTAARRKVEPQKLNTLMRGELDWIVMKALDKDRARRFATPQDLAADIERHLRGEAVVAAPASAAYRVRKFVRRNKGAVGAVSAVVVALAAGGSVAAWQAKVANAAKLEVQASNAKLLKQRDAAQAGVNQMLSTITGGKSWTPIESFRFEDGRPGTDDPLGFAISIGQSIAESLVRQTDTAEWSAYSANLALAQAAMEAGNYPEARKRLADAPASKRGWEWRLLYTKSQALVFVVPGFWTHASLDARGTLVTTNQYQHARLGDTTTVIDDWEREFGAAAGLMIKSSVDDPMGWKPLGTSLDERRLLALARWHVLPSQRGLVLSDRFVAIDTRQGPSLLVDTEAGDVVSSLPDFSGTLRISQDGRVLLAHAISNIDLGGDYIAVIRTDVGPAPEENLYFQEWRVPRLAAILASSPNGPSGLTITTPDGTRRIVGGSDKTVRFYEAIPAQAPAQAPAATSPAAPAADSAPGATAQAAPREVAVFRMPDAVTNLQMTGDGTRLIISLADGSARVWDIRDPQERRKDLQAEWAERVPAGSYLDTLWASDTPDDKLYDAVINDASLSPLRRLVAVEILEERIEDTRLAAEQARDVITKDATPQTDPATIRVAAAAKDVPPRVKEQLISLVANWQPPAAVSNDEQKLAAETAKRQAAESDAAKQRVFAVDALAFSECATYDTGDGFVTIFYPLTPAAARHISRLPGLVGVNFDEHFKEFDVACNLLADPATGHKPLTDLQLFNTNIVTDDTLKVIARADTALSELAWLSVSDTSVTDAGLTVLAGPTTGLKNLTELYLRNTIVTDVGLTALARADTGLKHLITLDLTGTKVTDEGIAAVKARFPGIKIIR